MYHELALFAGAGGGLLASHLLNWRPICAVEKEPYCREVLLRRQQDGLLPLFPIWDDANTFDGRPWRGAVDIITAGFPCQPFSVAGKRLGAEDPRNLWPTTLRIISEVGPPTVCLENVPGLAAQPYFWEAVLPDLAQVGYDAKWHVVSAADVGAPHLRKRLWIVATNANGSRLEGAKRASAKGRADGPTDGRRWWEAEPRVGRVADGVAHRMDRLKALGNGQVPAVAADAFS